MKNLKKLLCMVLCIALMSTAAFAAPSDGSYSEISDPIVEKATLLDDLNVVFSTSDTVTFDNFTDASDSKLKKALSSNVSLDLVTGKSGGAEDKAVKFAANSTDAFTGALNSSAGEWRILTDTNVGKEYNASRAYGFGDSRNLPIVVEFDVKFDTNTDGYGLQMYPTWDANADGDGPFYIFGSDGKILGSNETYEAGKWYHFKWDFEACRGDVYITPEGGETKKIVSKDSSIYHDKGSTLNWCAAFIIKQNEKSAGDTKAGMTIDNWRHYYYTKPASGTVVSPEGNAVSGDENFIFRVTAEAEEGDEIDLRVDGTTIASFEAWEGIYDYAADVDHCTIDAGAHVLSAYKVTDGFEEKIAEKIINVAGRYAGAIPANGGVYPTGVETFDDIYTEPDGDFASDYFYKDANGLAYVHRSNIVQGGTKPCGASGLDGDNALHLRHLSAGSPDYGIYIINNNAGVRFTQSGTLEMEFDIKVTSTTNMVTIYGAFPLWHDENINNECGANRHRTILLNQNGKVAGTDVEYKADEWMHFKLQYDYDKEKWNVWKDSVQIIKDRNQGGLFSTENGDMIILSMMDSSTDSTLTDVYLDNLSIRQYFDAPSIASVSYATDSASGIATTDLSVTENANSVTVTVDTAIDTVSDSDVTVLVNGVAKAVSGVTYNADAKAVTVPLTGIEAGDSISVTIATKINSVSAGNLAFNLNVKATGLYIAQNKVIGSSIKTQMYNGGAAKEAMLVAVVFDGNRMTDVSIISETIPSGETVYTFPLKAAPGSKEVKLMVWDNGMQPILEKAAE